MSNWLLKLHLFLFYSSVACTVVFLTVYFKTYTDCSYHEIGILCMCNSLGGALLKPLICSYADRQGNHKECLMLAVAINGLSTFSLALVPFYPQLLFAEPHPRLMWYLVALVSLAGQVCLSLVVTLSDVFVVQECLQSRLGEHFGQYRIIGGFGWALSSISVAMAEPYILLPYLSLPFLASSLALLIDLPVLTQLKEIHSGSSRVGGRSTLSATGGERKSTKQLPQAGVLALVRPTIATNPAISPEVDSSKKTVVSVYATVEPDRLRQTRRPPSSTSVSSAASSSSNNNNNYFDYFGPKSSLSKLHMKLDLPAKRGSDGRISIMTQLDLLIRLSRYDRHHLVKYLAMFIIIGAFNQTHYVFYLQYCTEILRARDLIGLLFTLSALIQVSNCVGETLGLLWIARFFIDNVGRDISLLLVVLLSGLRCTLIGYLVEELNIWTIAMMETLTGLLFGLGYTLMIECASAYLSILDRLLLVEPTDDDDDDDNNNNNNGANSQQEANFCARLEELKEVHSIETIRFAIRATVQGIFSGACEGVGFAIGPLLAGIWLSVRQDSLETLYRDMTFAHSGVLLAIVLLEFALMRLLLGSRSKIDRLMIGGGSSSIKSAS